MSKSKSVFVCQSCGQESPKWTGKCSGCNEWNTLVEQLHNSSKSKQTLYEVQIKKAIPVSSINENSAIRLITMMKSSTELLEADWFQVLLHFLLVSQELENLP